MQGMSSLSPLQLWHLIDLPILRPLTFFNGVGIQFLRIATVSDDRTSRPMTMKRQFPRWRRITYCRPFLSTFEERRHDWLQNYSSFENVCSGFLRAHYSSSPAVTRWIAQKAPGYEARKNRKWSHRKKWGSERGFRHIVITLTRHCVWRL